jgi:hypothetical protein
MKISSSTVKHVLELHKLYMLDLASQNEHLPSLHILESPPLDITTHALIGNNHVPSQ